VSELSWQRRFDDPIILHVGGYLVTPEDAATYKLRRRKPPSPEWQTAISELMLAVDRNGPTMLARIGFMKALNRH
jgi:hypothetical protein